ncbi:hypothetical protein PQX77_013555 [Marasmius sp. AFHP31]|nr:hypothetical protein PQX77_013555 [Marasmius sp. AFHP31]
MNIVDLPGELITEIASYLDVLSAYSLSLTCRSLRAFSQSDSSYWSTVLKAHQRFNPSPPLPLPPYQDLRELDLRQLHNTAVHMANLDKNLSSPRPILRHAPTNINIRGVALSPSLTTIPGTSLMLLNWHRNKRIICLDYEQGKVLCSVERYQPVVPISHLYHQPGRCSQVIRIGFGSSDDQSLSMLYVDYRLNPDTKLWEADMELFPISVAATSDIRLTQPQWHSLITTDAELVVYKVVRFNSITEAEQDEDEDVDVDEDEDEVTLDVVALNITTGVFTQISTGIVISSGARSLPRYTPVLKDKQLFLFLEEETRTHLWHIPGTLLPYRNQHVEPRGQFLLTPANDIGHCYPSLSDAKGDAQIDYRESTFWPLFRFFYSPYPALQATLTRHKNRGDDILQYRRWSIPTLGSSGPSVTADCEDPVGLFSYENSLEHVLAPEVHRFQLTMFYSSMSSFLCVLPGKPSIMRLTRLRGSPPHLTHHDLVLPEGLNDALERAVNVAFDEGMGVAVLMTDSGVLWVLRFGSGSVLQD